MIRKSYFVLGMFVVFVGLLVLQWENTTGNTVSSSPLSAEVKGGGSKTPVEVSCQGPEHNDIRVRETVVRTYSDGSRQNFTDLCRGKDYLNYYQCSRTEKAKIISCWNAIGKGAVCKEGRCLK